MKTPRTCPVEAGQAGSRRLIALTSASVVLLCMAGPAHAVDGGDTPNAVCVQDPVSGQLACGKLSQATDQETTAIGTGARALAFQSVAVGSYSLANADSSTAIGSWSHAEELSSTAVGRSSYAADRVSTAVGADSAATAFRSTALGADASASGMTSTAAGYSSNAAGPYTTALGSNSEARGPSAIAVGVNSYVPGTAGIAMGTFALAGQSIEDVLQGTPPTAGDIAIGQSAFAADGNWSGSNLNDTPVVARGGHAIALGTASQATAAGAMALGAQSRASAPRAVALGQGSVADQPDTVSIGTPGNERRITHVAPGIAGTDAVNVNQLNALDSKLQAMGQDLRTYAARSAAKALAMPSIPQLAPGETWAGLAAAHHDGQNAVGAAAAHQVNAHWNIGVGISTASSGNPSVKVQTGWKW